VTAEEWISAFAAEAGLEAPTSEEIDKLLKIAAVAAHSSERIAAPVACWLVGSGDIDLDRAREIADGIGEPA
jgi:hypothetical protein